MPYIVVESLCPRDKSEEVAKMYLEVIKKFPLDTGLGTRVVPMAAISTFEGIRSMSITEVKEGNLEKLTTRTISMMTMFRGIQGYQYEIRIYLNAEEALGTLGMKLPT